MLLVLIRTVDLTLCYYDVTCMFQSESTHYSCRNVKELLAQKRCNIWVLSGSNGIRTHNHLVCKRTLNHLAKQAKWLSFVVSTYLYRAFDCMFLSCHVYHHRVTWCHILSHRINIIKHNFCNQLFNWKRCYWPVR